MQSAYSKFSALYPPAFVTYVYLHVAGTVGRRTISVVLTTVAMRLAVSCDMKPYNTVSYNTSVPTNQLIWSHTS